MKIQSTRQIQARRRGLLTFVIKIVPPSGLTMQPGVSSAR